MKKPNSKIESQKRAGEVELARIRLAKAESELKLAKRRRKEARQAARRAKKQAKLAKQEVAEATVALTEVEAKLGRFQKRTVSAKTGRKSARAKVTQQRTKTRKAARKPVTTKSTTKTRSSRLLKETQPAFVPKDIEAQTATASTPGGGAEFQNETNDADGHSKRAEVGDVGGMTSLDDQPH